MPVYEFDAAHSRFSYAFEDLRQAFARPKLILTLTRGGFLSRYPGFLQGAFWIIVTTTMTAVGLGLVYGQIFGRAAADFLPYVATGVIVWTLIGSLVNAGPSIFVTSAGIFGQMPISKSLFAVREICLATLIFAFKLIVLISVLVIVHQTPTLTDVLLSLCGLIIVLWTGFWYALAIGTIGARFRDVTPMVAAVMTALFFVTPIFWEPERLGRYEWMVKLNPFFHYVNIVRGPLLERQDLALSFAVTGGCAIGMMALALLIFGYFARRLGYWT